MISFADAVKVASNKSDHRHFDSKGRCDYVAVSPSSNRVIVMVGENLPVALNSNEVIDDSKEVPCVVRATTPTT